MLAMTSVVAVCAALAQPASAAAITSVTMAFTGPTATVGGVQYAKSGVTLTLTVNTDAAENCVVVSGAHSGQKFKSSSPFVFTFTVSAGDGVRAVHVDSGHSNGNNCNNIDTSTDVQYAVDNAGPTLAGTISPAPNAAGWNKAGATVGWTAADPAVSVSPAVPGSGVVTQPGSTGPYNTDGTVLATQSTQDRLGNTGAGSMTLHVDGSAPTITGSRTPAANGNGWNNMPVTVSFACTDTGPSGMKSCTSPTTLGTDAAGQSVTGTATDNADNTSTTTVSGVNIDRTPPTLSGAPTTSPNGAGWYHGNVTIHWTGADVLAGIDSSTAPTDTTFTTEGSAVSATATVSDKAGNSTTATSTAVKIDRTAPVTSANAPGAWNNTNVTVALTASDNLSGVAATHYSLDGGADQVGASVPISAEGDHILQFWSVDNAGNTEAAHTVHVKIDRTPPTISHSQSPAANADGWNNRPVTVTFTCNDGLSGIASCTSPVTVSDEGQSQPVTGTATDNAGNSATDPATVSLDLTKPTITAGTDRAANGNGWYDADVIVTYSCADALAGIKSCSTPDTRGEGHGQSATGTAVDAAGNSSSATVSDINVDKTPPALTGAVTTPPNADGWYDNSVVVHWTCADALSGVAGSCPADAVVSGEGSNLSATATIFDKAGNASTTAVPGIKIDTTPPVTQATVPDPLPTGWYAGPVTVTLDATDNLSGASQTYYQVDDGATHTYSGPFSHTLGGTHTITYWSTDHAGNVEDFNTPGHTVTLSIDDIAPLINGDRTPAADGNGWNNSNVTVRFTCSDAQTGMASCTADHVVSAEGASQSVIGTAVDHAGNSASDTVSNISIDRTPPTLTGDPTTPANGFGWYSGDVTVHWAYGDKLSGIDPATVPTDTTVTGEGNLLSTDPVTVSDLAGNTTTTSVGPIKIDRTPPTLNGDATTPPNVAGWYNGDVIVHWTAADALSGLNPSTVPADSVLTGEGDAVTASATVSDKAGNSASATSAAFKIDRTPPTTLVDAPTAWVNHSATITLDPSDNLSGVAHTYYAVDGGAAQNGASIVLTTEGVHDIMAWSVDVAGNAEAAKAFQVKIDETAPTISHTQSPLVNANGWNHTAVTVTFTCSDALSGVASCTDPQTVTGDGQQQPAPGTAVDNAGNTATDHATVSIDTVKPTITGASDRDPDHNGWYNHDVTVSFSCADSLSGVHSCEPAHTLSEGAHQSVTGTTVDAADNSATATGGPVDVDETAPTLSGASTTAPNGGGWYRAPVTVHWTCADALSGIDSGCPDDNVVAGEGADLGATTTVYDIAGNSTTKAVDGLHIDTTAPTTGIQVPDPRASGWYDGPVAVSLDASDALSGLAATYYRVDAAVVQTYSGPFSEGLEGIHTLTWWSTDVAGNVEDAHSQQIKVDQAPPTITATRTPLVVNANGWNNEPVLVHFDCADADSGVATCPADTTVSTQGQNQSVTGTAVDNAGNTASVTVSPINVDTQAPALAGAPTSSPNGNGWYHADVVVHWTCSDATSGIDGSCPADSTVNGEASNLGVTASVSDKAGNSTVAMVSSIDIDRTAPTTSVNAPNDWVAGTVTLDLSATDNLSGVEHTYFTLDGGSVHAGNQLSIGDDGTHTVTYWSIDKADNEERHHTATVLVDKSAPTISHTQSPEANGAGWNNADVTVTFVCADAVSGVKSCAAPATVSAEGTGQTVTGKAIDKAGNTATDTATVSVDKTPPTITASRSRSANAQGWSNTDVMVTFDCHDALSGVTTCSAPTHLAEGKDQSATGTATDAAGNSATATLAGVNVDETAPTLTGAPSPGANAAGWYRGDVVVHWTCSDALSGIDGSCPADSTVSGSRASLSATASVNDLAGNTTTSTVSGLKIDRTAPTTAASVPVPYRTIWYAGPVPVTLNASDDLSGVARTSYRIDGDAVTAYAGPFADSLPGTHTVTYWSEDAAGNVESAHSLTLSIDNVKPTITGAPLTIPNTNGWHTSPVTVHFSCADAETAIASCTPDVTLSADGASQSVTGTARDAAGNTATYTVSGLNLDSKAPTVGIGGVANGGVYVLGNVPTPTCLATDALSGLVAPCSTTLSGGTSSGVGFFTYQATATDRAGNTSNVAATYQVTYNWGGFLQPINDTAHQTGLTVSVFKAGSTIPVKLQLLNASGATVTPSWTPQWITPVQGSSSSMPAGENVYTDPVTVGGSYLYSSGIWQFNWASPKIGSGAYWRVGVKLDDGTVQYVNIVLR
jgi:hypothetical protein